MYFANLSKTDIHVYSAGMTVSQILCHNDVFFAELSVKWFVNGIKSIALSFTVVNSWLVPLHYS